MAYSDHAATRGPRDAGNVDDRRGFLATAIALVAGGIVTVFPFAAGLLVFLDPLRRKGGLGEMVRVATLEELPADGAPRPFPVVTDRVDAWNRFIGEPVGMVFLRRAAGDDQGAKVEALNAQCPHAGCFVDFVSGNKRFQCPCHDSAFEPNGVRIDPERCPSPRDLDQLEVEVRTVDGRGEVWVRFQNYRAGTPEKIAEA